MNGQYSQERSSIHLEGKLLPSLVARETPKENIVLHSSSASCAQNFNLRRSEAFGCSGRRMLKVRAVKSLHIRYHTIFKTLEMT